MRRRGRRGCRLRGHRRGRGDEVVTQQRKRHPRKPAPEATEEPQADEEAQEEPSVDTSQGSSDELAARLADAETKRDEYLALAQRVQADFENYRKRAAREQERLVSHAHERLVHELLPVLDDLERTLEAAERHEEAALVDGVRLVERSLRKALEKEGLVEIATDGSFDPHVHEALLAQTREGAEPGTVVEVLQRGYRMGDKVVRPARVIVAE
ncbi:MAG: nucleotide exchange factor GrpE [Actinobacteria bacterium]|nr:MAG: nucleotide exchange factor GrpE [Actinomycetota bacterium]TML49230.1 MAG: nucleotide exchange factor GrpE [Actinomycetota bacterium]TML74206.1 MAG: nucleotide exchange factor GrpE [Actinomycetota bacterium]